MARASPVTAVEVALARRRRLRLPLALALLIGLAWVAAAAWNGPRSLRTDRVPAFGGEFDQFGYGSLSFERDSFIPHLAWQALPQLFPGCAAMRWLSLRSLGCRECLPCSGATCPRAFSL
jgi:hypothetical protein